jgi:hypothetical protein
MLACARIGAQNKPVGPAPIINTSVLFINLALMEYLQLIHLIHLTLLVDNSIYYFV